MTTFQRARSEEQRAGPAAGDPGHGGHDADRDAGRAAQPERAEPPRRPGQVERAELLRVPRGGPAGAARRGDPGVDGAARRPELAAVDRRRRRSKIAPAWWPTRSSARWNPAAGALRPDQPPRPRCWNTTSRPRSPLEFKRQPIASFGVLIEHLRDRAARARRRRRVRGSSLRRACSPARSGPTPIPLRPDPRRLRSRPVDRASTGSSSLRPCATHLQAVLSASSPAE